MAWQTGNEEWKKASKNRPFKNALMMELAAAEQGRVDEVPKLSARAIVRAQLRKAAAGDAQAFQAIADRVDGKVPQAIVGDDESPPLLGYREWLAWMIADGVKVGVASRTIGLEDGRKNRMSENADVHVPDEDRSPGLRALDGRPSEE